MGLLSRTFSILAVAALIGCQSAESHMADGDDLYQRGYYDQALAHYQFARRADPMLPGIDEKIRSAQIRMYIARGDQLTQGGQWDDARRAYEEVRRIDPNNEEVGERFTQLQDSRAGHHFARGTQLLSEGNPFDAIPELEQTLALQPDHTRASAALQRALERKREQERRAETAYQQGLQARDSGRLEDALRYFDDAVTMNPFHVGATQELRRAEAAIVDDLVARGDEAMAARRFADALTAYREAQRRDGRRPALTSRVDRAELEARAESLAAEGDRALERRDWEVAFESFETALRTTAEPERFQERFERARDGFAASLVEVAGVHEQAGRYEEALAALQRIAEFHPGYRDVRSRYTALRDSLAAAEQYYAEGRAAQQARDLLTAKERFDRCVRVLPGYLDTAMRLVEIDTSIKMAERFYERALGAERTGEAQRAQLLYEECLAVARPFRDASDRLVGLHRVGMRQAELPQYDEACRFQAARDLQKARELLLVSHDKRPGYRDTEQRITDVEATLAAARQAYRDALAAEEECRLADARDHYGRCLSICSPYADVEQRLQGVTSALGSLREARRLDRERHLLAAREHYVAVLKHYPSVAEARDRKAEIDRVCDDIAARYREMKAAERVGKFRRAFTTALGIQKLCLDYEDVDTSVARLESEADYADGRAFEDLGRNDAALRCYARCEERDPKFRDVRHRARDCRRRLGLPKPDGR